MNNPIEEKRRFVEGQIKKSFDDGINVSAEVELEKAHQDGDVHPNHPDWVWVSSAAGGKGDWRKKGGRTHTAHSENEKKFKDSFKDASDEVLNKVISGQIQSGAHERKWAQDILNSRKSSAKSNAAAKKIIDLITIQNSKYTDIKKVVAFQTDKGNWAIDYDGNNTGLIINKRSLSEATLKQAGVKIEKPRKSQDPRDGIAQKTGFKDYAEMSGYQHYVTTKNLLKSRMMSKKTKDAQRKQMEQEVAKYEQNNAELIAAKSKRGK